MLYPTTYRLNFDLDRMNEIHIHTYTYIHTHIIQLTPLGAFQWPITSSVMLIGLLLT